MRQGGGDALRGPSTVLPGSTIEVEVGAGTHTVYAGTVGGTGKTPYPVGADRKARIPTTGLPSGARVIIATGIQGADVGVIVVEVSETE